MSLSLLKRHPRSVLFFMRTNLGGDAVSPILAIPHAAVGNTVGSEFRKLYGARECAASTDLDRKIAALFYFLDLIKPFELKAALTAQRFVFASFVDPSLAPA